MFHTNTFNSCHGCFAEYKLDPKDDWAHGLVSNLNRAQFKSSLTFYIFFLFKLWHCRPFTTEVRSELYKILSFPWFSKDSREQCPFKMKPVASSPCDLFASFQLRCSPALQYALNHQDLVLADKATQKKEVLVNPWEVTRSGFLNHLSTVAQRLSP